MLRDHRRGGAFHLRARQVGAGGPGAGSPRQRPGDARPLRWHGAEEVEHRSVAHDLHVHLGGSFVTRQLTMLLVIAILVYLLADGTRTLLDQDPSLRGAKRQGFLRTWWRLGKQGLLPNLARTFRDVARYFNPWYHPEHEANTQEALEYLANSPAARRAANA